MVEQDRLLEMLPCFPCKNRKTHLVSLQARTDSGFVAVLNALEGPDPVVRVKTAAVRLGTGI